MQDLRDLHSLILAKIFQLVQTAVEDRIVDPLVGLDVDHAGQVITAERGKKSAHFHGQTVFFGDLTDLGRDFREALFLKRIRVGGEIIHRQSGAVLDTVDLKPELILHAGAERIDAGQLLVDDLRLFLLGAREEMQADDLDTLIAVAVADHGEDVVLIHAELTARRQTDQQRYADTARLCRVVDQPDMEHALRGKGADAVVHCTLDVRLTLVDAGKNHAFHIRAGLFADGQFAGGAYLDLVKDRRKLRKQKGIRLDGKAQSGFFAEVLLYQCGACCKLVGIEDIRRHMEVFCQ